VGLLRVGLRLSRRGNTGQRQIDEEGSRCRKPNLDRRRQSGVAPRCSRGPRRHVPAGRARLGSRVGETPYDSTLVHDPDSCNSRSCRLRALSSLECGCNSTHAEGWSCCPCHAVLGVLDDVRAAEHVWVLIRWSSPRMCANDRSGWELPVVVEDSRAGSRVIRSPLLGQQRTLG